MRTLGGHDHRLRQEDDFFPYPDCATFQRQGPGLLTCQVKRSSSTRQPMRYHPLRTTQTRRMFVRGEKQIVLTHRSDTTPAVSLPLYPTPP
jgi:hypothetical protein